MKAIKAMIQNKILKAMATRKESNLDITISIGRNIGKGEMGQGQWFRFKADIMEAVDLPGNKIHFIGQGVGHYEGTEETSFTVTFTATQENLEHLEDRLPYIARQFEQEAIALTRGKTELVKGAK